MKIKAMMVASFFLLSVFVTYAQDGRGHSVEEKVKAVKEKFTDFKLDKEKSDQLDNIFTTYFTEQNKLRKEMKTGSDRPDFDQMRAKMEPAKNERDEKLKAILTEEQYKKWKDDIEPSFGKHKGHKKGN